MVDTFSPAQAGSLARDGEASPTTMQRRDMVFEVRAENVNSDKRTVELSFSSTAPYERWWGIEILDHSDGAVRLGRLNGSAALLVNHETSEHVGVVERAWISGDKGYATVRFGKSARATEVFEDVRDGIRKLVSVGYQPHKCVMVEEVEGRGTYTMTDWEPYEISIVSIPADTSVGVGRDGEQAGFDPRTLISKQNEEDEDMPMTRDAAQAAPAVAATAQAAPAQQRSTETAAPAAQAQVAAIPAAQTVDVRAVQEAERGRIANIRAMGQRLDCGELADAAISDGRSVDQFVTDFQSRAGSSALRVAEAPIVGMSERDLSQFSFVRLLNHVAYPADTALARAAGFEIECSNAARNLGGSHQGAATIPIDVLRGMTRAQNVGTAAQGGNLVATNLLSGSFIDMLRNAMAVQQMGATILNDLQGNYSIPRQTGGATGYWIGEGADTTESTATFDQVALTPKTVSGLMSWTRKMAMQSSIDVEAQTRRDLSQTLALALDVAAITGTGASGQPRGLLNTSGIGSVVGGTNGGAPSWANIVALETATANANAAIGNLGYLTNTKVRGKLKVTERFAGTSGAPIWADDNTLNGYKSVVSNQVPSNLTKGTASAICSAVLFGNWSDLFIGMWSGLDFGVDTSTQLASGGVRIAAFLDADIAVRHPESFAAMVDALTT